MSQNFGIGAAMGGLCHIPLSHWRPKCRTKIGSTAAHTAFCADNDHCGLCMAQICGDICHKIRCAGKGLHRATEIAFLRCCPAFERHGRTGISGPITKSCDPTASFIGEMFEVIQRTTTGLESGQKTLTIGLALIGMAKHDVPVPQRRAVIGQFF